MTKRINYEKMKEVFNEYLDADIEFLETENKIYIYDFNFINYEKNSDFSKENIIDNHLAYIEKEDENSVIKNIERGFVYDDKFVTAKLIIKFLNKYKDKFIFEEKYSYKKCKKFLEEKGFKINECDNIAYTPFNTQFVNVTNDKLNYVVDALNGEREEDFRTREADVIYLFLKGHKNELLED